MNRLIRWALRQAWRKGIQDGNRVWIVLGGLALALRILQRAAAREEKVVYRDLLEAGQTLVISHEPAS